MGGGRFYSGEGGQQAPLAPHWRRRWLSNESKMNIVRCPEVPNDLCTMYAVLLVLVN